MDFIYYIYQTEENPYVVHPSLDYNNDGVREMLFSPPDGEGIIIYDVVQNTTIFSVIDQQAYNIEIQAVADVDGDSELELIITVDDAGGTGVTKSYVYSTGVSVVSVKEKINNKPTMYKLHQNYPNPFNPTTKIEYEIQKTGFANLKIYNSLGQLVRTLVNEPKEVGNHSIIWDGRDDNKQIVPSGIYFYQLRIGDFVSNKRMIFLK
ncbi:MAG: T9SS type A sorting domain-containing protein [bacterium]